MALANPTSPFVWGAGGAQKTPEQIAREREIAAALMKGGIDYSPVEHWAQGAARMAQAGVGALKERWADEAETAGREGFQSRWDSVFGGGAPVQTAAIDPVAAALISTPQTATDAVNSVGATLPPIAASGFEYTSAGLPRDPDTGYVMAETDPRYAAAIAAKAGGTPAPSGDMQGYVRQGLVARGLPEHIADGFMLNFQDESGFDSGINEAEPTVPGSRGGYGLYQLTGPRRVAYEQYAAQKGVDPSNVDAQLDFMMSELQGPEARAAQAIMSAPDTGSAAAAIVNKFLRPAEEHRASRVARYTGGAAVPTGGGSQSPLQMAQAPDMAALLGLASDPWANDAQRSIVESLMGQQMKQQDPMYQLQMRAAEQGLTKGDLEIQQLLNPAPPKPIEVGGVLLDPNTMQPIFDSRQPSDTGFTLSPGQQRFDAQGNPIATGGPEADKAPTVQKVTLADGSEMAVQWDGNTQAWVPINAPQGGGNLQPDGLTEGQAKLTLFQTLQTETQPVLLDLEAQFDPANLQDAAARSTPIAGNFFQSEQGQIYNASAKAWAEGALRIATGAAATPEEMERTLSTYFAQPGDTPNTIAFKAQLREMYNRAVNNSLGRQGEGQLPLPSEFAQQAAPSAAGGQAAPTGQSQPRVISQQDYQSLPSGSPFIAADDPTRTVRIKP